MLRRPPETTLTDTLVPTPTLLRSHRAHTLLRRKGFLHGFWRRRALHPATRNRGSALDRTALRRPSRSRLCRSARRRASCAPWRREERRSEEHTSELQSLMRISYAVFCLKKKKPKASMITIANEHRHKPNNT